MEINNLFFVISSFLFFTLFRIEKQRTGRIALRDFFVRRLLRIYPLMVGAPLLFMIVMYGHYDFASACRELALIATATANLTGPPWVGTSLPFTSHLWTLSFEFQVYLVLPLFFYACERLGPNRGLVFLGVVWLVCVALRAMHIQSPHPTIYFNPILRPDSVLLGMVLALIRGRVAAHVLTAVACFVLATIALFNMPPIFLPGAFHVPLYVAVAIASGAMLWLALNAPSVSRFLSWPPLVYLGKRSFGLYVFHLVGMAMAKNVLVPMMHINPANAAILWTAQVLVTFGLTVAMAILSYRFIERPFLVMKDARAVVLSRPV